MWQRVVSKKIKDVAECCAAFIFTVPLPRWRRKKYGSEKCRQIYAKLQGTTFQKTVFYITRHF